MAMILPSTGTCYSRRQKLTVSYSEREKEGEGKEGGRFVALSTILYVIFSTYTRSAVGGVTAR